MAYVQMPVIYGPQPQFGYGFAPMQPHPMWMMGGVDPPTDTKLNNGISPVFLTPNAFQNQLPQTEGKSDLKKNNLTVDVDVGARRDGSFHDSDMNILMMLAASQKRQCDSTGSWSSGKGLFCIFIALILLVIIIWIILAVCNRNRKHTSCCKKCGKQGDECTCKRRNCNTDNNANNDNNTTNDNNDNNDNISDNINDNDIATYED